MSTEVDLKEKAGSEIVLNVLPTPVIGDEFQDGGLRAWLVVFGAFLITAVTIGLRYGVSLFHQLASINPRF